ncbi:MAG: hypothetical protein AAFV33_18700, partial [Chloroflexota bacterium]
MLNRESVIVWFLRLLLAIAAVLLLCISVIRVGYELAVSLEPSAVFATSTCELPCWHSLRERETTATDTRRVLSAYELDTFSFEWTFRVDEHLSGVVQVDTLGNRMGYLILTYAGCPLHLLLETGLPDNVIDHYGGGYTFEFYDEGVHIRILRENDFRSAIINFEDPATMRTRLNVP